MPVEVSVVKRSGCSGAWRFYVLKCVLVLSTDFKLALVYKCVVFIFASKVSV